MPEHRREILVFEVGGRRFALDTSEVRELVRAVTIVPLPMAPAVVEGVLNVRGEVVPVIDIRPRLGLAPRAEEPSDHLIIAWAKGRLVAIRVDHALELTAASEHNHGDQRNRPPSGETSSGRVARFRDELIPLLVLDDFLTAEEFAALERWVREPAFPAERERRT